MNTKSLAKLYDRLTPEERFRLILAAAARGDEAERDRLARAAGRLTLEMSDHAPYAHALAELGLLIFLDLVEDAAFYLDAFQRRDAAEDFGEGPEDGPPGGEGEAEAEGGGRTIAERSLDLALGSGYILRTKADGWELFCERMNLPPFAAWEGLPGLDRLRGALRLAERVAFVPEGFLRWLNDTRPAGGPELTAVPLTAEGVADALARRFRDHVEWWSG